MCSTIRLEHVCELRLCTCCSKFWRRFQTHMTICITVVSITSTLWLLWSIFLHSKESSTTINTRSNNNSLIKKRHIICLLCQILFIFAASLEIFDFPPFWGILDAHSLWHAATVPLGFMWYHFWDLDFQITHVYTLKSEWSFYRNLDLFILKWILIENFSDTLDPEKANFVYEGDGGYCPLSSSSTVHFFSCTIE